LLLDDAVLSDAKVLWDYHRIGEQPTKADVILGLGSYDISVAEYAAKLFLNGMASWLAFAGGMVPRSDLLQTPWQRAEAEVFAAVAKEMGVPERKLVLEPRSLNTGQNFLFTLETLRERRILCNTLLVVTKPNMERRARATAAAHVPNSILVNVVSPPIDFNQYVRGIDAMKLINLMVGDLQRITVYPRLGFQVYEEVPPEVDACFHRLVRAGFTDHLVTSCAQENG
jgi:uncharacterized SAM-binding protein YcdF (DUF218 family)